MKKISLLSTLARSAMVVMGVLAMSAGLAWGGTNGLVAVSSAQGKDNTQVLKIQFRNDVNGEPVAFTTTNPNRLVLDFGDTHSEMGRGLESLNAGIIKSYQVVQSGERTRLVINLANPTAYEVRKERNLVFAVLEDSGKAAQNVAAAGAMPAGSRTSKGIKDVDFKRGRDGDAKIIVTLSEPGTGIDIQQKAKTIQVDFLNTSLPSPLQRRLDVSDFGTPAQLIETFANDKNTRMVVTPKGKWDYYAYQTGDQFVLEVRPLPETEFTQSEKPVYSGEKLSLNFQNVDVRAVLQVIADFTGLNIIASDTVTGSVTLRLKDVPWDQALDIIMRSRGLDKRVVGNVIWIAPRDELAAKEKAELEARKSVQELEPLVTKSYPLNYIRADEAAAVLSGLSRRSSSTVAEDATCSPSATGIKAETTSGSNVDTAARSSAAGKATSNVNRVLSDRGGASYDLTTNTLVVTDTADRQAAVAEVLQNVDVPSKQVMIEARIVIADDGFERDLGAKLGFQTQGKIGSGAVGIAGTGEDSASVASSGVSTGNGFNVNLPANVPGNALSGSVMPSLGFTILSQSAQALLSLELQAMEADSRGKIISNPRVVTTNLRPAAILQGTQIPYQTTSTNGTNTEFKDAVLCLLVAPQVLNNDSIILNVEVQKDAQGVNTSAGPAIDVRRVKTQVRVNNGETAVLGGIFEQQVRDDTSKVPLLGDIPVLGHLFKTNQKQDNKTEMLIFLTPRILDEQITGLR